MNRTEDQTGQSLTQTLSHLAKEANLSSSSDTELPVLSEDEISLLIVETEKAFSDSVLKLRKRKLTQQLMAEYNKKLEAASFIPKTGEQLLDFVLRKYGPELARKEEWDTPFIIPTQLVDLYQKLSFYFSGDEKMQNVGLNPKKGLLIFGNVGCGKTTAMKVFEKNPIQPFRTIMCNEVVGEYETVGNGCVEKYSQNSFNEYRSEFFGHSVIGYAFDDLGTEKIGNFYKSTIEVMAEIIMRRYDSSSTRGRLTHITTNILPDDILNRYGLRVYDRMKAMFNIISIDENAVSLR